jgi:hypothetical protein
LRDALAQMLSAGVATLAVIGPGNQRLGVLTLAGIRARTRNRDQEQTDEAGH